MLAIGGAAWPNVYTVRNTADSGTYSLRWAMQKANEHDGADTVAFAATTRGSTIRPHYPLPPIADDDTTIDADINNDGKPDVTLNGQRQRGGFGLMLAKTRRSRLIGLAVVGFPLEGVYAYRSQHCTIRSCHIGVNRAGTKTIHNNHAGIWMVSSTHNTIGGSSTKHRNVIACADALREDLFQGILLSNSSFNTISGNYVGVAADGAAPLGNRGTGIWVDEGRGNIIGGSTAGRRNLFGGLDYGVVLAPGHDTQVAGNYFGLGKDGSTVLPIRLYCVAANSGSRGNTIGGPSAKHRNVFAGGASWGVLLVAAGTQDNTVRRNYFGTNAAGTLQRRLQNGVQVQTGPGENTIESNYFAPRRRNGNATGVFLHSGKGSHNVVRGNRFGVLPNGKYAPHPPAMGVRAGSPSNEVTSNLFVRCKEGLATSTFGPWSPIVSRNTFRECDTGILVGYNSGCRMGNLGNANTEDDGRNRFRDTKTWHVRNLSANRVRAENNNWGTTSAREIEEKIYDRKDDPSLGRVDFIPLLGGVTPSGRAPTLTLAAAAAPTAGGVKVVLTLSRPAEVHAAVRNIAGRPVRTLCRAMSCDAGTSTLLWDAQSDGGLMVPGGAYLVEIAASSHDGSRMTTVATARVCR